MAKQKTRRRFDEPRIGVSQLMIETEARELGREVESYSVQSLSELKEMVATRARMYKEADMSLEGAVMRLPEREQQAIMCMLGRDLHLVLAAYFQYLANLHPASPEAHRSVEPISLPFSEWLFGA